MNTNLVPYIQTFGNKTVRVVTNKTNGRKFAIVNNDMSAAYPLELCAMAGGKDAWMRNITCKCKDCGVRMPVSELNEGFYCEPCLNKDME